MKSIDALKSRLCAIHDALDIADFYWRIGYYGLIAAASVHAFFIALFYYLGVDWLAWVNVLSTATYLYAIFGLGLQTLRTKDDRLIGWLVFGELMIHNLLASYALSKDAGFSFYIYTLVILPFFVMSYRFWIYALRVVAVIGAALWIDMSSLFRYPKVPIEPGVVEVLHHTNLALFLIVLAILAYLYAYYETHQRLRLVDETMKDALTGLYNRRYVKTLLPALQDRSYYVMLIDIDHFKTINDRYGHLFGDHVLLEIVRRIKFALPSSAVTVRWGGEEILVLLDDTSSEVVEKTAQEILHLLRFEPIECQGVDLAVTATIGIACRRTDEPFEAALLRADTALYRGKEAGRNRIQWEEL